MARIGVLAVQGAFIEHEKALRELGQECVELRQRADIRYLDALVLPGGESTVQGKLLRELEMFEPLRELIAGGLPTLATCAGLILLASKLDADPTIHFGTFPATVRRNAYGRQLGSFHTRAPFWDLGEVDMTFIRAPYIVEASPEVEILAKVDNKIVAARYENQIGLAFHPELDKDRKIFKAFLQRVEGKSASWLGTERRNALTTRVA